MSNQAILVEILMFYEYLQNIYYNYAFGCCPFFLVDYSLQIF